VSAVVSSAPSRRRRKPKPNRSASAARRDKSFRRAVSFLITWRATVFATASAQFLRSSPFSSCRPRRSAVKTIPANESCHCCTFGLHKSDSFSLFLRRHLSWGQMGSEDSKLSASTTRHAYTESLRLFVSAQLARVLRPRCIPPPPRCTCAVVTPASSGVV
jgi:hypothetical protein